MTPREFVLKRLEEVPKIGTGVAEVSMTCGITRDEARAVLKALVREGLAEGASVGPITRVIAKQPGGKRDSRTVYATKFYSVKGNGHIYGAGYDAEEQLLEVEFRKKKGGRTLYRYFEVPKSVGLAFMNVAADPVRGPHAHRTLIRGKFPYMRVR